jgi:hypothetical protein
MLPKVGKNQLLISFPFVIVVPFHLTYADSHAPFSGPILHLHLRHPDPLQKRPHFCVVRNELKTSQTPQGSVKIFNIFIF